MCVCMVRNVAVQIPFIDAPVELTDTRLHVLCGDRWSSCLWDDDESIFKEDGVDDLFGVWRVLGMGGLR